jgi:CheY-like chemotaxis protein
MRKPKQKDELRVRFGSAVKTTRKNQRISQDELAHRAGLHRTYISDIERGARNLSLASIQKLAAALEVSVPALFTDGLPRLMIDILMIEDDSNDVEIALAAFRRSKCINQFHVESDGEAALDYLFGKDTRRQNGEMPGLILLDLHLPKLSGLEVLRQIKNDERTRRIPVVVLTGSQDKKEISECQRLGVNACIEKPVDMQRLCDVTPELSLHWALLGPKLVAPEA